MCTRTQYVISRMLSIECCDSGFRDHSLLIYNKRRRETRGLTIHLSRSILVRRALCDTGAPTWPACPCGALPSRSLRQALCTTHVRCLTALPVPLRRKSFGLSTRHESLHHTVSGGILSSRVDVVLTSTNGQSDQSCCASWLLCADHWTFNDRLWLESQWLLIRKSEACSWRKMEPWNVQKRTARIWHPVKQENPKIRNVLYT